MDKWLAEPVRIPDNCNETRFAPHCEVARASI
jgi:hypothetical protein